MNLMIRNLASWRPLTEDQGGYSVAIACMKDLSSLAVANLMLCARADNVRLREIILVFDCPVDQLPDSVHRAVEEASAIVRVTVLGYNPDQYRIAHRINWGWVYSWLSWSLAIGHSSTRAVIIHDLDALPMSVDFFEQLYDHFLEEGAEFCGIRWYRSFVIDDSKRLAATFELTLDAAYLRRTFRPFDLFNKLRLVDGRVVDFDTMLHAQYRSPRRAARPIDEDHLVHPSQLICQYTDLISGRSDFRGRAHGLPMLAYFLYLGSDPSTMEESAPSLADANSQSILMFGRRAYLDAITPESWAWMEKQIRRVEQHLFGGTRPEIESYLGGIIHRAGSHRTVGVEAAENAVPER